VIHSGLGTYYYSICVVSDYIKKPQVTSGYFKPKPNGRLTAAFKRMGKREDQLETAIKA